MRDVDLICFPSDDRAFAEHVRAVVDAMPKASIEEIQARLRDEFPAVRLVKRSEMADMLPNERPTWYAFRYGRVVP